MVATTIALGPSPMSEVEQCPSSDNLRLIRHFEKGGSGSSGVRV